MAANLCEGSSPEPQVSTWAPQSARALSAQPETDCQPAGGGAALALPHRGGALCTHLWGPALPAGWARANRTFAEMGPISRASGRWTDPQKHSARSTALPHVHFAKSSRLHHGGSRQHAYQSPTITCHTPHQGRWRDLLSSEPCSPKVRDARDARERHPRAPALWGAEEGKGRCRSFTES